MKCFGVQRYRVKLQSWRALAGGRSRAGRRAGASPWQNHGKTRLLARKLADRFARSLARALAHFRPRAAAGRAGLPRALSVKASSPFQASGADLVRDLAPEASEGAEGAPARGALTSSSPWGRSRSKPHRPWCIRKRPRFRNPCVTSERSWTSPNTPHQIHDRPTAGPRQTRPRSGRSRPDVSEGAPARGVLGTFKPISFETPFLLGPSEALPLEKTMRRRAKARGRLERILRQTPNAATTDSVSLGTMLPLKPPRPLPLETSSHFEASEADLVRDPFAPEASEAVPARRIRALTSQRMLTSRAKPASELQHTTADPWQTQPRSGRLLPMPPKPLPLETSSPLKLLRPISFEILSPQGHPRALPLGKSVP